METTAVQDQIDMATELAEIITDFMPDLEDQMSTADLLDFLAKAGFSLMPSPVSPVRPEITLASEAYFAELGVA